MHTRHRIPTIFNLSMVDVLCCALGCVILLWLINFREAKRRALAAGETARQLKDARQRYATAQGDLAALNSRLTGAQRALDQATAALTASRTKYEQTAADLDRARAQAAGLAESVRTLEQKNTRAQADLRAGAADRAGLKDKLASAGQALAVLNKEVAAKKKLLVTLNSRLEDLTGRLLASEELVKQLRQVQGDLKKQTEDYRDKLAAVDARALLLARDLEKGKKAQTATDLRVIELLAEKAVLEQKLKAGAGALAAAQAGNVRLQKQVRQAQAAIENRFAGLELSGKKVVFLVDISGSMKMRDENTASPAKWPAVCETVGKLMRSLPDLSHYQVVLFSDGLRYLHGHDGQWLTFEGEKSAAATLAALHKIDPNGGTKMAPAIAEVFRFRAQGLDTIYFFSDGLPNDDDDLPPEVAKLAEGPRTVYLSNRVRQLLKTVWNRPQAGQPAVRINTVGFFFDTPEVGAFLWALAREHDGGFVGMSRP